MKNAIERMPEGVVLLKYLDPSVAQVSYLLVDLESRTAAVIDPSRDVEAYLEDAWRLGSSVKHLFLTELSEEVPLGVRELQARACATAYVGAWGRPDFDFIPLKDGDALEFGRVRLRVVETPGHRLESIMLLVEERDRRDRNPCAALTGKTVGISDIGRPRPRPRDGFNAQELASKLYDSIREKVLPLPDPVRLFPAQEGELEYLGEEARTLGAQRLLNAGLQVMSRKEFVRRVTFGMDDEPNPPPGLDLRLRSASLAEAVRAVRAGAQLVDMRDPRDFAAAHLEGSLNLPWVADFEEWAGAVVDRTRPIVIVAPIGGERPAAERLVAAGFEHVASFLRGGAKAFEERQDLVRRRRRRSFATLGVSLLSGQPALLLDTRGDQGPHAGPSVPGIPLPLERLRDPDLELPPEPEIIVCDDSPYRSSAAASILAARGFKSVVDLAAGLALWGRSSA